MEGGIGVRKVFVEVGCGVWIVCMLAFVFHWGWCVDVCTALYTLWDGV